MVAMDENMFFNTIHKCFRQWNFYNTDHPVNIPWARKPEQLEKTIAFARKLLVCQVSRVRT